ncbi:hypothetical protein ACVW0W_006965 [Bradyrhizobium sp. USDA 4469]
MGLGPAGCASSASPARAPRCCSRQSHRPHGWRRGAKHHRVDAQRQTYGARRKRIRAGPSRMWRTHAQRGANARRLSSAQEQQDRYFLDRRMGSRRYSSCRLGCFCPVLRRLHRAFFRQVAAHRMILFWQFATDDGWTYTTSSLHLSLYASLRDPFIARSSTAGQPSAFITSARRVTRHPARRPVR